MDFAVLVINQYICDYIVQTIILQHKISRTYVVLQTYYLAYHVQFPLNECRLGYTWYDQLSLNNI